MRLLAKHVMNREVFCVLADLDVRDLTKLLLERGYSGAPVTKKDGTLLGVVSQSDLLRNRINRDDELVVEPDDYGTARIEGSYLPRGFQIEDVNTAKVSDVMTPVVFSVQESTPVEEVARTMRQRHIHRVIVERAGKVVGIISPLDLLAVLSTASKDRKKPIRKK